MIMPPMPGTPAHHEAQAANLRMLAYRQIQINNLQTYPNRHTWAAAPGPPIMERPSEWANTSLYTRRAEHFLTRRAKRLLWALALAILSVPFLGTTLAGHDPVGNGVFAVAFGVLSWMMLVRAKRTYQPRHAARSVAHER